MEKSNREEKKSVLDMFRGTFPQLIASMTGALSAVSDGMQYGWTAPVIPVLLSEDTPVKITRTDETWLESIYLITGLIGLPITMYLVDKIGRRKSILVASATSLLAWIIIAFSTKVEHLYIARSMTGIAADVAFVATPMYISEIADQKIRGFLSGVIYVMMLIGILLIYSIAPFVPFYVPSIVGVLLLSLQLSTFGFMPESPYFLLMKGRMDEARSSLNRLRGNYGADDELEQISLAVERQRRERGRPQDLVLIKTNRKALIVVTFLTAAQHFCGITVILMNVHSILAAAGSTYIQSDLAAIIFSVLMLVAATFSSLFLDRYGRKFLLISSSILTGICLLVLAIYFNLKHAGYDTNPVSWIPIVCIMSYAAVFKFGLGLVPIVIGSELFSTKVKAMGMSLADGLYVAFGFITIEFYQRISESYGIHVPFYTFGALSFVTTVFCFALVPETKGKTLEEIQSLLRGNTVRLEHACIA